MNRILYVCCAFFALCFGSCTRDYFGSNDGKLGDDVSVHMSISNTLDAGSGSVSSESNIESSISKIRIIICQAEHLTNANLPKGYIVINKKYVDEKNIPDMRVIVGQYDIYVIANETDEMTTKLDAMRQISQLKELKLSYENDLKLGAANGVGAIKEPLVMSQAVTALNLNTPGTTYNVPIGLLRAASKVRFTISFNASSAAIGGGLKDKDLTLDSIRIFKVADQMSISPNVQLYDTKPEKSKLITGFNHTNKRNWVVTDSLYITEHSLSYSESTNPNAAAYLLVYTTENGTQIRHRIDIGNSVYKPGVKTDYNISRNIQYNVTGKITKYGEVDGAEVSVKVLPWNTVDITEDVGHYVTFVKASTKANSNITGNGEVIDGGALAGAGETIRITCKTNIGAWYAITTNKDGAETTTVASAANTDTEQTINITIGPSQDQTYTVRLYHSALAPQNIGVPIKTLTFKQKL